MDGLGELFPVVPDFGDGPNAVSGNAQLGEHDEILNKGRGHSHLPGANGCEYPGHVRKSDQWEYESGKRQKNIHKEVLLDRILLNSH